MVEDVCADAQREQITKKRRGYFMMFIYTPTSLSLIYISPTRGLYFSRTILRFNFIVGVNSPASTVHSWLRRVNFFICSHLPKSLFKRSTSALISSLILLLSTTW